jgi:hypothetical protein
VQAAGALRAASRASRCDMATESAETGSDTCPACRTRRSGGRRAATVGRPFDECSSCGSFVTRDGFNEWDLMSAAARTRCLFGVAVTALLVGVAVAIVATLLSRALDRALEPAAVIGILAVGVGLAGAWLTSRLSQAVRRSRSRMSDPMYRARLVEYELAMQSGGR